MPAGPPALSVGLLWGRYNFCSSLVCLIKKHVSPAVLLTTNIRETTMALSKSLKRKVDSENREFKEEWTEQYVFILPTFTNANPMCLICNRTVSVCKSFNIKRHHNTEHPTFKDRFPPNSEARKKEIERLKSAYSRSSATLVRGFTSQQKVTSASLKASWVLAKHNKPFTDSEVFKEMMVTVLEELASDKSTDSIIASVKQMPLSTRSANRRIEVLSDAVQGVIIHSLGHANEFLHGH